MVTAPTWTMLAEADRFYGPFHLAQVISNSRSRELFRPGSKHDIVLTVGRAWDEAKNMRRLDQAASALSWPVFVAGDGAESYRSLVRLGNLSTRELSSWYSRAAIFAAPVRYEPFGLSILEAALSGCALVLGDIPSLRENWDECAKFVDPGDPEAIAAAIQALIANPDRRQSLGYAARARATAFHPENMGRRYNDAYTQLQARRAMSIKSRAMVI
jgi:glycogen(starch) synthase